MSEASQQISEAKEVMAALLERDTSNLNPDDVAGPIVNLRRLLALPTPHALETVGENLDFISWLSQAYRTVEREDVLSELTWIVTNLTSGPSHLVENLRKADFFEALNLRMDDNRTNDTLLNMIWAVGNIAGDSTTFRDFLLDSFIGETMIKISLKRYPSFNENMRSTFWWTLSNFLRGKPEPNIVQTRPIVTLFLQALVTKSLIAMRSAYPGVTFPDISPQENKVDFSVEIKDDVFWGLSYASGNEFFAKFILRFPNFTAVLYDELISAITRHNGMKTKKSLVPIVRCLGNFIASESPQPVMQPRFLEPLFTVFTDSNTNLRKEILWIFSNVVADTSGPEALRNHLSELETLLDRGLADPDEGPRKEAGWIASNLITSSFPASIRNFAKAKLLGLSSENMRLLSRPLEAVRWDLAAQGTDVSSIDEALSGMNAMTESADGAQDICDDEVVEGEEDEDNETEDPEGENPNDISIGITFDPEVF